MDIAFPWDTTITTPAVSKNMTTKERVKDDLRLTVSTYDSLLDTLIEEASAMIVAELNRELARQTLVDYFQLEESAKALALSQYPIVSITSIVEDGVMRAVGEYEFSAQKGLVYRLDGASKREEWSPSRIVVTHQSGYVMLTTLPQHLERAAVILTGIRFLTSNRDPAIREREYPDVYRVAFSVEASRDVTGMPPAVLDLIARERRVAVG